MTDFTTETEQMDKKDRGNKATEQVLYDLTGVYSRSNRNIPVKLGNRSYIATDGSFISINSAFGADLTGPQRFRMQSDTASHETWHDNESDLESKKTFSEENDVAPYTAGVVINIVEDHYVDYRRTMEFPGQKKSLAYKLQTQMHHADNPKFDPIEKQTNRGKALVNGLLQVSALGFPIIENEDDVDDDVLDFLTWALARVKDVREMSPENAQDAATKKLTWEEANARAQRKRRELSQEIFEVLVGHLDDPSDADDYVKNSQPFPIPFDIPDDVDMRPMTQEEREKFDKMKDDMPSISMPMPGDGEEGDGGDDGDEQDGQQASAGGAGSAGGDSGQQSGDDQQDGQQSGAGDDAGDEQGDGDEDGDGGAGGQPGDEQDGDDSDAAGDGDGDADEMKCSDCGVEFIQVPREEAENAGGLMDSKFVTDGGTDMVFVCPDCGQMVDPETGEHQGGAGDDAGDEQGDEDGDQSGGAGDEQGDEQDGQQDGDESGEGGAGGDEDGDEGDESGAGGDDADGDESGDEEGDGGAGGDGDEDGQQDGDEDGDGSGAGDDADGDESGDQQDGGGRQDPFSEKDGTDYDDERHDVRQYSRDELARERDDMMTLAKHKNVAANYGVDDTDISEVEDRHVRRYQKIKLAKQSDDDSMYVRQMARDERVQNNVAAVSSDEIRQEVMEGDLKDEIEEAFRELKTRNRFVEAQVGEDLNMDGVITNRALGTEVRSNYKHMQRAEKGDRAVGVALDMSGSMHEQKAKVAIGALYAATEIIGDSFVASAFMTSSTGAGPSSGNIYTPLITGPDEDFMWKHLDGLTTDDMTPTASGVLDGANLLEQASRPEKVLVVVTDGKPNRAPDGGNSGNKALDAAASAVQQTRARGTKVIGLAVGSNINAGNMQAMFGRKGEGYFRTDDDNLADTLLSIYRQQMKLVQEGAV